MSTSTPKQNYSVTEHGGNNYLPGEEELGQAKNNIPVIIEQLSQSGKYEENTRTISRLYNILIDKDRVHGPNGLVDHLWTALNSFPGLTS